MIVCMHMQYTRICSLYEEKKEEIWLSPMTKAPTPAELSKGQNDNTNNATKKFDYTALADRLRTVSWSNYGHPTGVVNLVYGQMFYSDGYTTSKLSPQTLICQCLKLSVTFSVDQTFCHAMTLLPNLTFCRKTNNSIKHLWRHDMIKGERLLIRTHGAVRLGTWICSFFSTLL